MSALYNYFLISLDRWILYLLRVIFVDIFVHFPLVSTVTDLEAMIAEQRTLMDKLTVECKQLTNKLEDTTTKHK